LSGHLARPVPGVTVVILIVGGLLWQFGDLALENG
jgi:hypothetical protein